MFIFVAIITSKVARNLELFAITSIQTSTKYKRYVDVSFTFGVQPYKTEYVRKKNYIKIPTCASTVTYSETQEDEIDIIDLDRIG